MATAILLILTTLALPLARVTIKREREHELRSDLWEMRDAIDRDKDYADRGAFQTKAGSEGRVAQASVTKDRMTSPKLAGAGGPPLPRTN